MCKEEVVESHQKDIQLEDLRAAPTADKKNASKSFTTRQKVGLVMLATVEFSSYCSMSIMAPFYPREARDKGMSESLAGFVFSFYALIIFVSSPIFGKILPKVGVKLLFIGGIVTSGICSIIFGTLHYIDDFYLFATLSFLIRGLEALGAAAYATAGYVLVINIFPNNGGTVRGILETFVGLGMSAGPAIGGFLYAIGGFGLPFYVVGTITLCVAPLNVFLLPSSKECNVNMKSGSFRSILKIPSVIVTCFIIALVSTTWGFLDPTLEPHLRQYNLSASNIGLIFLLLSGMYGIFSPFWGWVSDKVTNYWCLMTFGLFMTSFSLVLLGPSPILPFLKESIWLHIIALSALGIFVAMGLMPTYQSILDGAVRDGGFSDNIGTHSLVAGLWSCIYSLGEMLGPAIGGALLQQWGFPTAATCLAGANLLAAICTSIFFYMKRVRSKVEAVPKDSDSDLEKTNSATTIPLENGCSNGDIYTIENNGSVKM
ncbi:PREDICTED: MFS-type transporter SLC18B1-like [Nicrophorus vespilloides]|nr:PREDICTED: MFS-type transporter SLC18B1-like isoform X2 [Nicrophorus vespilloides]XP_017781208.1 PREDICTED: MFS-type transporter SLC18B1-like [Nicrophorus vespilloides]